MNLPDEQGIIREIVKINTARQRLVRWLLNFWRRIENTVFALVLLLGSLYFLLQSPPVQNWLIQKITSHFSKELNTRVEIRRIDFEFFDNLVLDGLFVADQTGDTLLCADQLVASLNTGLLDLATGKLEFNEITLRHAHFHRTTYEGHAFDNLKFIVDYFKKPDDGSPKKNTAFTLKIQNLNLVDVDFRDLDNVGGLLRFYKVARGHVRLNAFDLVSNLIDIESVSLVGMNFTQQGWDGTPLPDDLQKRLDAADALDDSLARLEKLDTISKKPLVLKIHHILCENGFFRLDKFENSPRKETPEGVMDVDHLAVGEINAQIDSFKMTDQTGSHLLPDWKFRMNFEGRVRHLSGKETTCGLVLSHFEAAEARVCDTTATFFGMKLQTPLSELSDSFSMRYERFDDFNDYIPKVEMDGSFHHNSKVALADLFYFNRIVGENVFFKKNKNVVAQLEGHVFGTTNRLKGRDVRLKIEPKTSIECDFRTRNLAASDEPIELDFDFKKGTTDMKTLREIIPDFNAPPNFDKLGNLDFQGKLTGFASNFVVEGDLQTDMGPGKLDMQLDMNEGKERAKYAGNLAMRGFELGKWTGNSDFGRTTFSVKLENGNGLTPTSLRADLRGRVDSLDYRGYVYRNLMADGSLDKFLFKGQLGVADKNLTASLRGTVDFQATPEVDVQLDLTRLNLEKLHFSERPIVVSLKIPRLHFQGHDLNDLIGSTAIRDLRISENGRGEWTVPSIEIGSELTEIGEKHLFLTSSLGSASLEGRFQPQAVGTTLQNLTARFYPEFSKRFGLVATDSLPTKDAFRFHLNVFDTHDFTTIFDKKLGKLSGVTAYGNVDGARGFSKMNFQIPSFRYGEAGVDEVFIDFTSLGSHAALGVIVGRTLITAHDTLAPISLDARLDRDTMNFKLDAKNLSSVLNNVSLSGQLFTVDSTWQVRFEPSDLLLMGKKWGIEKDNFLRFGRDFVQTKNFQVRNGNRVVSLNSKEKLGMILSLNQFDLEEIHRFWKYRNLTFDGNFEVWADVDNIFRMEGIKIWFSSTDTVWINRLNYGFLNSYAEMKNLQSPLDLSMDLVEQSKNQSLAIRGVYLPPGSARLPEKPKLRAGDFDLSVVGQKFPLAILETFIPGISTTTGSVDLKGRLWGSPSRLDLDGRVKIIDGWTKIDYLGTRYHIENQAISLSSYSIAAQDTVVDAVGILRIIPDTIRDARGRPAVVTGGIWHDHFSDWRINLGIESPDFWILNTTKKDNPDYYGTGIGRAEVVFGGTFDQTKISVTATTGAGSRLFIPVGNSQDASEVSFVRFKEKKKAETGKNEPSKTFKLDDLSGLDFEMNLSLTPEAEVQLIFDEAAGDIISGRGHGDLGITYDLRGELKMYGDYTIDNGNYLFTYFGIPILQISKPFTVKPGGTIRWDGDPYGAIIDIEAGYAGLTTSPYNFISEEVENLSNDNLKQEARRSTRVNLLMHLTGALFKPEIGFDIEFPDLTGELKTAAENKLRLARQTPNEMSRQAFGLIVIGGFLPANSGVQATNLASTGVNTISQMVTSQLSNYLSSLASSLTEGGFISSIDVDIAYNEYQNTVGVDNLKGREFAVRLSSSLANDRVRINVGSNFGLGGGLATANGFQGEDFVVEISLTKDRRWVLRGYQRLAPDVLSSGGRRLKIGGGISFQREYDSMEELFKGIKKG